MHLLHGLVLGVIFGLLVVHLFSLGGAYSSMGEAILYSIVLWVVSPYLTKKVFESAGGFTITSRGLGVSFGSHIIYGLLLGLYLAALV